MTAQDIGNRITGFITWVINNPFAFLLWLVAVIITVGLAFSMLNPFFGGRLPTFGIAAQTAIYPAGIVYLLWGKV